MIALLEKHGIAHSVETSLSAPPATPPRANSHFSTEQKIAIFRKLFRGRTDVYQIDTIQENFAEEALHS